MHLLWLSLEKRRILLVGSGTIALMMLLTSIAASWTMPLSVERSPDSLSLPSCLFICLQNRLYLLFAQLLSRIELLQHSMELLESLHLGLGLSLPFSTLIQLRLHLLNNTLLGYRFSSRLVPGDHGLSQYLAVVPSMTIASL